MLTSIFSYLKLLTNGHLESKIIEVYTDANPTMAYIAIEKPEARTETERKFELIVIKNKNDNLFEADAVRISLHYVPKNSHVKLYCDKEGDLSAIKKGNTNSPELRTIIESIRSIEKERNLIVEYEFTPRKNNIAGRMFDKI